jgi:probable HAF family extracellular repeat protein
MRIQKAARAIALAAMAGIAAHPAWALTSGFSFQGLGGLNGNTAGSNAMGVSDDGTTVIGQASPSPGDIEAFRWTQSTGMVGLGDLPGGMYLSVANGVSADGSTIVGAGFPGMAGGTRAFRWTQATGMVPLNSSISAATDVSADGSIAVGFNGFMPPEGSVRWDAGASFNHSAIYPAGATTSVERTPLLPTAS